MAWIKEIKREENNKLKRIYEKAEKRTNETVANVLRVHSINPDVLEIHIKLYERIMFGESELSQAEREMIGVVVSKSNECPYCVNHHSKALFCVTENLELMDKISNNYKDAFLSSRELAICNYVEKLTKTPYKIVKKDILMLKQHNFSDRAIFDINQICAYFNYVNRIVHGLGVELE